MAYLKDMPPVLALIVESFVKHFHDLDEVVPEASQTIVTNLQGSNALVIGQLCQFIHLGTARAPGVVGGCIANFSLDVRISFRIVFGDPNDPLPKVLKRGHGGYPVRVAEIQEESRRESSRWRTL